MKTLRIKKILLTFVLVGALVGVQLMQMTSVAAETNKTVQVNNFDEFMTALDSVNDGDTIELGAEITISGASKEIGSADKHITITRNLENGHLVINAGGTTFKNVNFDGHSRFVSSTSPMIVVNGSSTFTDCTFKDCLTPFAGAAVQVNGTHAMFRNCTFENNVASDGGALWLLNGATTTINGCTFKGNSASGTGGAISITTYDSILNGDNNTITGNTAKTGGGIHNSGRLLLTNSLIYGNNGTMGADILNTMAGVTDIGSLDEVREAYHAIGLNPLEWVNDYDGTSFVDANVNTEKEDAFMKLSYEDYVAPDPDPEPSTEDPQPSTEPSSEPSQEEPKTEPSTEPSEEAKTEPVATPSDIPKETPESTTPGAIKVEPLPGTTSEAEKTPTPAPSSDSSSSPSKEKSPEPSVSSGDSKPTSTPASTTTNNTSTDNSRTDRSVTNNNTTNNYNNVTPKPEQQTNPPAQAQPQAQPEKEQTKTPQQTAQNGQKQPSQTKVEQSTPEQSEGAEQATQEATEGDVMKIDPSNNIRIDAKNSDVVFEVKDGVYSITVNSAATTAPATESTQGVNWYEIVKILLLGAIVGVMLWKPKTKEK